MRVFPPQESHDEQDDEDEDEDGEDEADDEGEVDRDRVGRRRGSLRPVQDDRVQTGCKKTDQPLEKQVSEGISKHCLRSRFIVSSRIPPA